MPDGVDPADIPPEEMLPPTGRLSILGSVTEAKRLLAEDRKLALEMLAQAGEQGLAKNRTSAPWDPQVMVLGHRLLHRIRLLALHKAQLLYSLKLQGRPVNTGDLWGN